MKKKQTTQIDPEVIEILRSLEVDNNNARIGRQIDPTLYKKVDQALKAAGGVWTTSKKAHVFDGDPRILLSEILETGILPPTNPLDFFPTPEPVARELAQIIFDHFQFFENPRFLEPSAGSGRIALQLANLFESPGRIQCVEADPSRCRLLESHGFIPAFANFLEWETDERFHAVVMNPPFNGAEFIKHIEKAFSLLRPDGLLLSVVPDTSGQASGRALDFWRLVGTHGSWSDLGRDAFKESGVSIGTCIVEMTKPRPGFKAEHDPYYPSWNVQCLMLALENDQHTGVPALQKLADLASGNIGLPGFYEPETLRQARAILDPIRDQHLSEFRSYTPLSADELSGMLGMLCKHKEAFRAA